MAIVFKNPKASIGEGLQSIGGALGQAIGGYAQKKQLEEEKQKQKKLGENLTAAFQQFSQQRQQSGNSGPLTIDELIGLQGKLNQLGVPLKDVESYLKPIVDISKQQPLGIFNQSRQTTGLGEPLPQTNSPLNPDNVYEVPGMGNVTRDQAFQATLSPNKQEQDAGKALIDYMNNQDKRYLEERKFYSKESKPSVDKAFALRDSIPKKKMALALSRDAIESGKVGAFSWANIAERTGFKELQNATGAQLVTASKENLLSNMSRVSAKGQNQWFEQRLNSVFPQVGQNIRANLAAQNIIEGELEMDEIYLKAFDEIASEDREKYGAVKGDIDARVDKMIRPQMENVLNKVMFKERANYEIEQGSKWILENAVKKVPKGTPLTPMAVQALYHKYGDYAKSIENAQKLGYFVPSEEQYDEWGL